MTAALSSSMAFPTSAVSPPQPPKPPEGEQTQQPSDHAVEAMALAGSAAIRRIIAERNELRRERERLRGANEELRNQNEKTTTLRDQYRQLATELLVQLRQIHHALQDASRTIHDLSADSEDRDTALMSLARRFSCGNGMTDRLD